jgi:hypothetical protein
MASWGRKVLASMVRDFFFAARDRAGWLAGGGGHWSRRQARRSSAEAALWGSVGHAGGTGRGS